MTRWKKICYSEAVRKLFEFYATGNWSLSKLAAWLNDQGFRTRNKRRLKSASGEAKAGPSGQQLSQLARLVQY
ncbi:MAG: recombinase family protein, partial [Dehalococcoidia bacterium]|nr:recombinase family protein [Dehalococcoidia bacterium]